MHVFYVYHTNLKIFFLALFALLTIAQSFALRFEFEENGFFFFFILY